eukprot:TRINITY_DN12259_c0_g2_i1.p1 TRINITY_DN12259_c0_g2~~TRINITY_DN12259_c0_g2_i1.p1  ORF type:complete len:102 (-),score=15.93 TRINITY_DN12259_c0_g2_i1:201-506(-)
MCSSHSSEGVRTCTWIGVWYTQSSPSIAKWWALKKQRATLEYEDKKFRKYQSWFANAREVAELPPVTLETYGSYGRAAKVLEDIRKAVRNAGVSADSWNRY